MGDDPLRVFYSYSHRDERMLHRLRKHLAMLRRHGAITEWYDRDIEAGSEWRDEIVTELDAADVILLLVSADFLDSDFCYEQEILRAVERSDRGEATVIAVMLRPVDGWDTTPFAKLQAVPTDARPVTRWTDPELAFSDAAAKIRAAIESRIRTGSGHPSTAAARPSAVAPDAAADPARARRLDEVAAAIAPLLEPGNAGSFVVVVGDVERNYYTQFYAEPEGIWSEAVSNEFVAGKDALGSGQVSRLGELGWNPPQGETRNWWSFQDGASPEELAALAVRTLNEVYGVSLDRAFDLQTGSSASS